jgi:hypothetical protein
MIRSTTIFALTFFALAGTAHAQDYYSDPAGQGQPGQDQGGYYDSAGGGQDQGEYYDPGSGQQPQPQQPQQQQPRPASQVQVGTEQAAAGEISGFELGLNWAGGSKVAIEPGWMFGRFGLYLLLGLRYHKHHEEASTSDYVLDDFSDPSAGAAHHDAFEDYDEDVGIDIEGLTYDIGLAARVYLLEELKESTPSLYLELAMGWRGAAYGTEIDWSYKGDADAFYLEHGDLNGDGDLSSEDIEALQFGRNKLWNKVAAELDEEAEGANNGLWWNLGIGGEYVFPGGFGVAGEAGLSIFYNTRWKVDSPYAYDDDGSIDEFDWEHQEVKYEMWEIDLGFYYSLALRYHF